jgi:hypothetical protein
MAQSADRGTRRHRVVLSCPHYSRIVECPQWVESGHCRRLVTSSLGRFASVIPIAVSRAYKAYQQNEEQPQQKLPKRHSSGQEQTYAIGINNERKRKPEREAEQCERRDSAEVALVALLFRWRVYLPPLIRSLTHSHLRRTTPQCLQWVESGHSADSEFTASMML